MINHLPILPILVPALAGALLLLPVLQRSIQRQRLFSLAATAVTLVIALLLFHHSAESTTHYLLGNWEQPFGIVLVADRLSTLLVLLTAVLSLGVLLYASAGTDEAGAFFHPLFQYQLMGIYGAFLTGDMFNLFVFFEILLLASYGLLAHSGGKARIRASVQYVTLNLIGSALFLVALGLLYGTLGTLNMANMGERVALLRDDQLVLLEAALLILVVVFGLKTALVPLQFWLVRSYAAATAPVAALFAIMTKVGIYGFYRVHIGTFGYQPELSGSLSQTLFWIMAAVTMVIAIIGVLGSKNLRTLTANLVLVSVATLMFTVAIGTEASVSAGLYYLIHSTLVTAALFLLADIIAHKRGPAGDNFVSARPMRQRTLMSLTFMAVAITVVGMPPMSGFIGKTLILVSAQTGAQQLTAWSFILIGSLGAVVGLSRAGTSLLWHTTGSKAPAETTSALPVTALMLFVLAAPVMVVLAGPLTETLALAAQQLVTTATEVASQ
ncbi:MAG: monovalent cation/H+ antiporter subunit D [Saccharospirillum sp.]